jgi:hypothetical protein
MKQTRIRFRKRFEVVSGNKRSQAATMVIPIGAKEGGPDNNHRSADQWLFVVSGKGGEDWREKSSVAESHPCLD